jgi:Arc/MetJ family transcription regulator
MNPDLMAQLPRSQREAVESAGYRVVRWAAAREVLQKRIEKSRIAGPLGEFLNH